MSTLSNLYLFTNKGNLVYRPVHELLDTKWKETGQHLSQEVGLASDEQIVRVFEVPDLKASFNFLIITNDGYAKQVSLSQIQPTRTYKSRAATVIKLKSEKSRVIRVSQVSAQSSQQIVLFTHRAYAVRYRVDEISTSGPHAVGVKSINLKPDDYVVDFLLISPQFSDSITVGLITQRGAFKQFKLDLIALSSRAKRGILVLRELKTKPHRIQAVAGYGQNHELKLTTSSQRHFVINTNDYPLGDRYSNGSFVLDPVTDGTPLVLSLGRPLPDGRHYQNETLL